MRAQVKRPTTAQGDDGMVIFGIDVSKHQGPGLDWPRIRASGIDFMIARASLATTPDPEFRANRARARQAGIPVVGAYHFLYPASVVSPAQQARLFLERVGDPTGQLTMLDIERDGRAKPRFDDLAAFAAEFAERTDGHPLLLYAPGWYWRQIGNPAAAHLGPLVASRYVPVERTPGGRRIKMTGPEAFAKVPGHWFRASHGGWTKATILQFTSSGKVPAHRGFIDFNVFRGTVAQLAALAGPGGAVAAPGHQDEPGHPAVVHPKPPAGPKGQNADVLPKPAKPPVKPKPPVVPKPAKPRVEPQSPEDAVPKPGVPVFHVVRKGDTLIAIATAAGWTARDGVPGFRRMLQAFPENAPLRSHPSLIHPGDRVRTA
jgi:lysozyme